MARKKRGQRYTAVQKHRILAAAKKEKLTAALVQKRFGVSPLTFYRWRGPVRGRKAKLGRPRANGTAGVDDIRNAVRARVQAVLPGIIREQVDAYVTEILGKRRPGRPRSR
jgi:transposase-like protein